MSKVVKQEGGKHCLFDSDLDSHCYVEKHPSANTIELMDSMPRRCIDVLTIQ